MWSRFDDVRGHARPVEVLQRAIRTDRLHHANLLTGPEGVGKRRVAFAAAALVNCESPTDGQPCGTCRSCTKLRAGSHPDVEVIEPDGRWIKIEQVRAIASKTRFRPYEGRRRVFIIEGAERMREEAANALLKTLEEPGGETVFFVITAQPHRLLSTIRSRCQPLRFAPLDDDDVRMMLEADGVDADAARSAAALARGSMARARRALDSPVFSASGEWLERVAHASTNGPMAVLDLAESIARAKDDMHDVLDWLRTVWRDLALRAAGASPERRVYGDAVAQVEAAAQRSPRDLAADIDRIDEAERALLGNVNPTMVWENLLLDLLRGQPR